MKANGFLLLGDIVIFLLGMLLLLTCLNAYGSCLKTMQKKLALEEAIKVAILTQVDQSEASTMQVAEELRQINNTLKIREIQVSKHGKVIFTLATLP